jgi:NADPH-dependent 2,4-dienoyl-CoA reductase/sulfur reductase-like enzyme/nitrite reductase/ring-hydroxylating ferredoxin subunit
MSEARTGLSGPDFTKGIELADVPEGGMVLGNAYGEAVLVVRHEGKAFAVGATCTHYSGPLAEGLLVDGQLRCPWHHACFDVRTGAAVGPPALNPLPHWQVVQRGSRVFVGEKLLAHASEPRTTLSPPSILIIGAGAAGNAAAETLRNEGYAGPVTLVGGEPARPVDRPNLSKDYLAGNAPEDWLPLRDMDFYASQKIELLLGTRCLTLDPTTKSVGLSDGTRRGYGALLLATGAEPIKLVVPGSEKPHVLYLRSLADSRAIIARAAGAADVVVVGASFIGLEVAAALRARGLQVHVVAPDARPLERVLGAELGALIQTLHEEHGVQFHLKQTVKAIEDKSVVLDDGSSLKAALVVVGIGVRPAVVLAEQAGLRVENGIVVDEFLESSVPGIFAAGDIARWPGPQAGKPIRVEHWVVAERQGQTAARNMLGKRQAFRSVPFFWSQHYDLRISYVGHAERWDSAEVAGQLAARDCLVAFRMAGKIVAVATLQRDVESLQAELLLERGDQPGLQALLASVAAEGP